MYMRIGCTERIESEILPTRTAIRIWPFRSIFLSHGVIPHPLNSVYPSNQNPNAPNESQAVKPCKFLIFCLPFFLGSVTADAQWEAEADPTAYALKGFSAHVGHPISDGRLRFQIGAFGAETPEWIHGNSGFTENSRGVNP
jgi:hypothetical protein